MFFDLGTYQPIRKEKMAVKFMRYLGGCGLDLFLVCCKAEQVFHLYDGLYLEVADDGLSRIRRVKSSNMDTALEAMVVHGIRIIAGGGEQGSEGGKRNFCLVDHDADEQTIFELEFQDPRARQGLFLTQIAHFDNNLKVRSSLINDNKVLVHNRATAEYLIFNLDMKVFWKTNERLQKTFGDSTDQKLFIIPNCGLEGAVTFADNSVKLLHSSMQETLLLVDKPGRLAHQLQTLKLHLPPGADTRELLVLSSSEEQSSTDGSKKTMFNLQKLSWQPMGPNKKLMVVTAGP